MTLDELFNDLFAEHFRDHHAHKECGIWHRSAVTGKACRPGFVYVLQFGDVFKIGATNGNKGLDSVKGRIAAINKQLGQKGRVVFVIETNCAQGFERWLHREYRERRVRTEFFRLSENDLRALRAMNQFNGGTLVFRAFPE